MSLEVLTRGGGGATASIFVTGLAETDTVSASKGGKTVQGVWTESASGNGHLMSGIKEYGTWAVTASNGTKTVTQNVLVDAALEFEIAMSYVKWLYNEGDECEDVTGGWSADGYTYTDSAQTVTGTGTKYADRLYLPNGTTRSLVFGTGAAIDLTAYSTMKGERMYPGTNLFNPWIGALGSGKDISDSNRAAVADAASAQNTREEFSLDISDLTGAHHIVFACTSSRGEGYLYKLWLE